MDFLIIFKEKESSKMEPNAYPAFNLTSNLLMASDMTLK